MAHLLCAFGLDVGHERLGANGISSWMFAVDDDPYPFARNRGAELRRDKQFATVIQHVRNPADAIPSIMVENRHSPVSYQFRRRHILKELGIDLDSYPDELERAGVSYLAWNRLIERMNPQLVVQVENCEEPVRRLLVSQGLVAAEFVPRELPPRMPTQKTLPRPGDQKAARARRGLGKIVHRDRGGIAPVLPEVRLFHALPGGFR